MSRIQNYVSIPLAIALVAAVSVSGCAKADSQPAPEPNPQAASHEAAPVAAAAGQTGQVLETMDAGNYTYVLIDAGGQQIWAAAPQFQVAVGDTVTVPPGAPMQDFHSQSMNRTFELIYFVGQIPVQGTAQSGAQMPAGHPPVGQTGASEAASVTTVDKPVDGHSIAEVFAKKSDLGGQKVAVRGKVVKANQGILGTNWYHLQDGSGSAGEGTNDLTITSSGVASLGQVITAVGTLTLDKDFGAGYRYDVILTEATVTAE